MNRTSGATGTTALRAELGNQRCMYCWRIWEVLDRQGYSRRAVAEKLGITPQAVSSTVYGKNHSPRVLDFLRSTGVPEKYLFDPRRAEIEGVETATSHNRKVA